MGFCAATTAAEKCETFAPGTQRLLCKVCQKRFTPDPVKRSLSEEKQELIEKALAERMSQRGIARTFKVSRDTIRALRKKSPNGSRIVEQGLPLLEEAPVEESVEYDEICVRKSPGLWLWLAICRKTRLVPGSVLSDRSDESFLRLRDEEVPPAYWGLKSFSDGLEAYTKFLPSDLHEVCTKGSGRTSIVEGLNTKRGLLAHPGRHWGAVSDSD